MRQHLVCVLLICLLLLNACTSAIASSFQQSVQQNSNSGSPTNLAPLLSAPWVMDTLSGSELQWSAFEETVRADLGQHPSTDQIVVSLVNRAQIPGTGASMVAVKLDNAGPYLTEIFAANLHALADAGYETFEDPALALPETKYGRSAVQGFKMPGIDHGITEDLSVLQFVVASPASGGYVMYSLTIRESLFAGEVQTFRRWVMDLHAGRKEVASSGRGINSTMKTMKEVTKVPPFRLSAPASEFALWPPEGDAVPSQAMNTLPKSVFNSPRLLNSGAPAVQTSSAAMASAQAECKTSYEIGQTSMEAQMRNFHSFVVGDQPTEDQRRTSQYNSGPIQDFINLWDEETQLQIENLTANKWQEAQGKISFWGVGEQELYQQVNANLAEMGAETPSPPGLPAPPWLARFKLGKQIWSVLPVGIQDCLSVMPSATSLQKETGWETYDDCHDGAVTTLSLAISGTQILFSGAGIGVLLEGASSALDGIDSLYKGARLTACVAGSRTGVSKFGQPAVKLDDQGHSTNDWRKVCHDQLIAFGESAAAGLMPLVSTGFSSIVKKIRLQGGTVSKWLLESVDRLSQNLGLDINQKSYSALTKSIEKISRKIDKFSERSRKIIEKRTKKIDKQVKAIGSRAMEGAQEGAVEGIISGLLEEEPDLRDYLLKGIEGAAESAIEGAVKGAIWAAGEDLTKLVINEEETVTQLLNLEKRILAPAIEHVFALLTSEESWTSDEVWGGSERIPAVVSLNGVHIPHGLLSAPALLTPNSAQLTPVAGTSGSWLAGSAAQNVEEEGLTSTELVLLSLFVLTPESEGGPLLTQAEREFLEDLLPATDTTVVQQTNLLQNLQALSDGKAGLGLVASLEEAFEALQTRVTAYQGILEALDHELAVADAGLNTLSLNDIQARQHVARTVDYLLVDRQSGLEFRGATDKHGIGEVLWLGSERPFSLMYHDATENLAAVTSFRSAAGLEEWVIPPVLASPVDAEDTDGDNVSDFAEWVRGHNPTASDPEEEWDVDRAKTGLLGWTDTHGYVIDVCAINPEQLAVVDMFDGLSLFQTADTPELLHRIPAETFGDSLVALHCTPYTSGHLLVETLTGALWSVSLSSDGATLDQANVHLVSSSAAVVSQEADVTPYWRTVAFAPAWVFLGDNQGTLQAMPLTDLTPSEAQGAEAPVPLTLLETATPIEGLAFQLDTLFVLTPRALHAYHVEQYAEAVPKLHLLGRVWVHGKPALNEWRRALAVAGDKAYVGGAEGLTEVDISDPLSMSVLRRPDPDQGMIKELVPVGGDVVMALTQFSMDSTNFLTVMDTDRRLSQAESVFLLPSTGNFESLAVVDGRVFAAAGPEGLVALNVLGVQSGASPLLPEIRTNFSYGRWEDGEILNLRASTSGRSFLQRVELYLQGERVDWDASPPFEFALSHEMISGTEDSVEFEFLFFDDKRQSTLVPFTLTTVLDARAPRLRLVTPTTETFDLETANAQEWTLSFSEPVWLEDLEGPAVQMLYRRSSETGTEVFEEVPLAVGQAEGGGTIQIALPENLAGGDYILVTNPGISDSAGNVVSQTWIRKYHLEETAQSEIHSSSEPQEDRATERAKPVMSRYGESSAPARSLGFSRKQIPIPVSSAWVSITLATAPSTSLLSASTRVAESAVLYPVNKSQQQKEATLLDAVLSNDIERAQQLLNRGADPHLRYSGGKTLLHIAAVHGRAGMVELLLAHGADVNARDKSGGTPLSEAEILDWVAVAGLLLARGADPHLRYSGGKTLLHIAAVHGRAGMVELLLAHGADVNARDKSGGTPLSEAEILDWVAVAGLLLARGADPHLRYSGGKTLLHIAAAHGRAGMVELLLAHGADVNARDNSGGTPLSGAAVHGRAGMVELLLAHGADVNARDNSGGTPLSGAAVHGRAGMVELLLARGADPHLRYSGGKTLLHIAAVHGRAGMVELLLAHGADVNARDKSGGTPLSEAEILDWVAVAGLLLARGADPHLRYSGGKTLLHIAAVHGRAGMVELLLAYCADVNARDKSGGTPLSEAEILDWVAVAGLLLARGADPHLRYSGGKTLLHIAAAHGRAGMVELLLAHGADVNARDNSGGTPLSGAAVHGRAGMVELLLAHGADVNARDNSGGTPLSGAAVHGRAGMVELLLARGADPHLRYSGGKTLLHIAAVHGRAGMVELLLAHGADVNARDKSGGTPLSEAEILDWVAVAGLLLARGADPHLRYSGGKTLLHIAAAHGRAGMVELLLAHGADVNARDKSGGTPLSGAAMYGHAGMVELLLAAGGVR